MKPQDENTVMEQLYLSLHHLTALDQMQSGATHADLARVGVLAWYYGLVNAASAMTAAQNSSFQEDHTGKARIWDYEIAAKGMAMGPFGWRVSSLVETTYNEEINKYLGSVQGRFLQTTPTNAGEAANAAASYLSGTAAWSSDIFIDKLRSSQDFKALGVNDFKTKKARKFRDERLERRTVGFLHQAYRYRGKANYREALFLAHGQTTATQLEDFVAHQAKVLRAFLSMAGAFAQRKLGKDLWAEFVADIEAQRAFTTSSATVWK